MKQRYDMVLYDDRFTIYGRHIDGAVFVSPRCRDWHSYAKFVDRMSISSIELKKENLSLSDVVFHIVRSGKDPSKILYFPSPASKGSFKDFLSQLDDLGCVYDDGNFVGIFMQRSMFDV